MSVFEAVAFVLGCMVIAIIGIYLTTVLLYAVSALIAFVALSLKLNIKVTPKAVIQFHRTFDDKGDCTNRHTNAGWPAQYVKYVIRNYFQIVWGDGWVSNIFNCLAKTKYSSRNNDSQKDVNYLIPIPRNDKSFDGIHTENLSQGENERQPNANNTNSNQPWA